MTFLGALFVWLLSLTVPTPCEQANQQEMCHSSAISPSGGVDISNGF